MEWVLRSPQIHSTFGSLGFLHTDGYHINENCDAALETILHNILTEDKYLRTYRRCIGFGQNIKKDLIPLLLHAKEDKTIQLLIRILVNLTIPLECLLSVDVLSKTEVGCHTIFEINNLLSATKVAFTDNKATKVIIDILKKNVDSETATKLSPDQCTNITNSLLLLRNVLHIPGDTNSDNRIPNYNGPSHSVQNQILWNIFSQSIDKVLIKLMTIPDATNWGVTMVQLIALVYKDQHIVTLHKLLNIWLETSLSESSEDNESNTSPPDRGSDDSSPVLTSESPSDSSDTGASGKSNDDPNSVINGWDLASVNNTSVTGCQFQQPQVSPKETNVTEKPKEDSAKNDIPMSENDKTVDYKNNIMQFTQSSEDKQSQNDTKKVKSENSDCGYGTQIENQESISTSSNEDDLPTKKPVHQKPHNPKQRANNKARPNSISLKERKRKKIVKRGKLNIINVQGLSHKTPNDDDISNILKEFTVDFLLKGYNSLVQTLHSQILTNLQLEIDTSHFFWLVTYFLKFATQIEMDLKHIRFVLSFDIVSYLTAEGVNLCEQFELAIKLDGNDLNPCIRRLHLLVTAIREFVQAIEVYKKFTHMCEKNQEMLMKLQTKMCETEELRDLLVLLLRHYNPKYHTKQYLQDLVVTNHILLQFLDSAMKLPEYKGPGNMVDHIRQFATPEIMFQYGLLLEGFAENGEFVNDCIFTLMHHVGGELDGLIVLFQPKILKIFTSIWESEFEICDDWSDLIEYVINTFIKKPHTLPCPEKFKLGIEHFDDDTKKITDQMIREIGATDATNKPEYVTDNSLKDKWTDEELSSLSWNYMQCSKMPNYINELVKLLKEDSIIKSRESVIQELLKQNLVNKDEYESLSKTENEKETKVREDEIGKLCDQLSQDGKSKFLDWVQRVLLETCNAKIYLEKKSRDTVKDMTGVDKEVKLMNFGKCKDTSDDLPVVSPVSYHSLNCNQSVPLVPWNCEQLAICKDLKFLQLLHKLGFHMPVDTGKVFIRIPNFWTADFLYDVAGKISPMDTSKLKFSLNDISESCRTKSCQNEDFLQSDISKACLMPTRNNFYGIHKSPSHATMVNFTPMPGPSYNNEVNEPYKSSWLELVQKAQECKLMINLGSNNAEEDEDASSDIIMQIPLKDEEAIDLQQGKVVPPFVLPTVMGTKQESIVNQNIVETEFCNNSAFETASVASDLTHMYVSDEDEKPELLICPPMEVVDVLPRDEISSTLTDTAIQIKRPRVQFSPS